MPISSHCLAPWARWPASILRLLAQTDESQYFVDSRLFGGANRSPEGPDPAAAALGRDDEIFFDGQCRQNRRASGICGKCRGAQSHTRAAGSCRRL